jgi:hypothetical protein
MASRCVCTESHKTLLNQTSSNVAQYKNVIKEKIELFPIGSFTNSKTSS